MQTRVKGLSPKGGDGTYKVRGLRPNSSVSTWAFTICEYHKNVFVPRGNAQVHCQSIATVKIILYITMIKSTEKRCIFKF